MHHWRRRFPVIARFIVFFVLIKMKLKKKLVNKNLKICKCSQIMVVQRIKAYAATRMPWVQIPLEAR